MNNGSPALYIVAYGLSSIPGYETSLFLGMVKLTDVFQVNDEALMLVVLIKNSQPVFWITAGILVNTDGVIRLAELYLIRAEARVHRGNVADVIGDINIIRARTRALPSASVPNPLPPLVTTLTEAQTLAAIEQERRIEFFSEWGHRWFDLIRWGRANDVLGPIKAATGGDTYSLFLAGQSPAYETLLIKDAIPGSTYPDSSINIRFVNLWPNSPVVNITLAATTTVNEVTNLSYKQITEFKKYSLPSVIPAGTVSFQVRDASTNAILVTYTLPASGGAPNPNVSITASRFKSITLVIKGLAGTTTGTNAYSILPVTNY
ncbi:MAG TPA: RagB/SusD family nutrient uptake outer membrane protein [Chitinophagaceae bacterium]|jgi:hypothetical protein|nr:RagB/SusD family nutrient uptake outer membrane protein [Chitinophagaceae bacterium]